VEKDYKDKILDIEDEIDTKTTEINYYKKKIATSDQNHELQLKKEKTHVEKMKEYGDKAREEADSINSELIKIKNKVKEINLERQKKEFELKSGKERIESLRDKVNKEREEKRKIKEEFEELLKEKEKKMDLVCLEKDDKKTSKQIKEKYENDIIFLKEKHLIELNEFRRKTEEFYNEKLEKLMREKNINVDLINTQHQ
jgi:chromosome segregation ATPase